MRPTYHALTEAQREKCGCSEDLEELESPPPDFREDGRSGEAERDRLTALARTSVNQGVRYTGVKDWEHPRYERELLAAAEERGIDPETLTPVDTPPTPEDGGSEGDSGKVETTRISFGEFTEEELNVLTDYLGDVKEYSPEKRKEKLLEHFRRLNMAGVRFEANAD